MTVEQAAVVVASATVALAATACASSGPVRSSRLPAAAPVAAPTAALELLRAPRRPGDRLAPPAAEAVRRYAMQIGTPISALSARKVSSRPYRAWALSGPAAGACLLLEVPLAGAQVMHGHTEQYAVVCVPAGALSAGHLVMLLSRGPGGRGGLVYGLLPDRASRVTLTYGAGGTHRVVPRSGFFSAELPAPEALAFDYRSARVLATIPGAHVAARGGGTIAHPGG